MILSGKSVNKIAGYLVSALNYLTLAILVIFILSKTTARWRYTVNHFVGEQLFTVLFIVMLATYLIIHRRFILDLLRRTGVKITIIALVLITAVYHKISGGEFIVLAYTLFAILFIRSFSMNMVSIVVNNESRTPAVYSLLCLVTIPFLLLLKATQVAEQIAVYAYYFLVITVVLRVVEMKSGIDRKNPLLENLNDLFSRMRKNLNASKQCVRDISWMSFHTLFLRRSVRKSAIFITIMLCLLAAQSLYWKKLIRITDKNPAYQCEIALLEPLQADIEFAPLETEIAIPLRIRHPFSNPRFWNNAGDDPVIISVLWFSQGTSDDPRNAAFQDECSLDKPLLIDESEVVQLKLRRPLLPGGRTYDVHLALMHKGNRRFAQGRNSIVRLNVMLQSSSGIVPMTRELQVLEESRTKLNNAWSDQLALNPNSYRSNLKLLDNPDLPGKKVVMLSIMNRGAVPWPATGTYPVKIGVAWVQKITDDGTVIYNHVSEVYFPLSEALLPEKRQIVQISFDPLDHAEADEIWIGLVHGEKRWFYTMGDSVLKVLDKRALRKKGLEQIQNKSISALKEQQRLNSKKFALFNIMDDESITDEQKYRSNIILNNRRPDNDIPIDAQESLDLSLTVTNNGKVPWPVGNDHPVNLGLLWFRKGQYPKVLESRVGEGRCGLTFIVPGGVSTSATCKTPIRVAPGNYEVWISPVHEGVAWFYEKGDRVLKLNVTVH